MRGFSPPPTGGRGRKAPPLPRPTRCGTASTRCRPSLLTPMRRYRRRRWPRPALLLPRAERRAEQAITGERAGADTVRARLDAMQEQLAAEAEAANQARRQAQAAQTTPRYCGRQMPRGRAGAAWRGSGRRGGGNNNAGRGDSIGSSLPLYPSKLGSDIIRRSFVCRG